jgi:hypothetical protein
LADTQADFDRLATWQGNVARRRGKVTLNHSSHPFIVVVVDAD